VAEMYKTGGNNFKAFLNPAAGFQLQDFCHGLLANLPNIAGRHDRAAAGAGDLVGHADTR
jgi:hypothetical protein